jgi:hypothetical protein
VPAGLREGLEGLIELLTAGEIAETDADGVLLWARGDVFPALRRFRKNGGQLPIYGLSDEPVDVPTRLRWVREGGDDLLTRENAVEVLVDRVRGEGRRVVDEAGTGLRIDRFLLATRRYLGAREDLVRALGDGGRTRYVDVTYLRDQVLRAVDSEAPMDAFGQRRGGEREQLAWPLRVLEPRPAEGELRNIGSDGLCFTLPYAPAAGEVLQVALDGLSVGALLSLEVRWQRRTGRERWEAGALAIACRITRGE